MGKKDIQAGAGPAEGKKLVHYKALVMCAVGSSAMVVPCDHPAETVSNKGPIFTSQVVRGLDEQGCFETLNTRYAPMPGSRPKP